MINSFKITNKDNTFYPQLAKLNLPDIEFKSGTNILIGKNGSGKTTIINALAQYTFCNKLGYSMFPKDLIELVNLYPNKESNINSIEIKADYTESSFKLIIDNEISSHEIMDNMSNVLRMMGTKNLSTGQKIKYSIEQLLKTMFKEDHTEFDWTYLNKFLENRIDDKSDIWYNRCKAIKEYTKTNHILDEHGYFTVLMDEPDRNLDIDGLTEVFEILNMQRKDVQVITAIHNPLLICKLAKNKNINFIELTPNYLNTILNFNK